MSIDRLRRRVAFEAAKLLYSHEETQYGAAKMKAARRLIAGEDQIAPICLAIAKSAIRCGPSPEPAVPNRSNS